MSHTPGTFIRRLASDVLFGNYFLAFCIVALSYETTIKNGFFINGLIYYIIVFFAVVVYYSYAYINDSQTSVVTNPRSVWYHQNRQLIFTTQLSYTLLITSLLTYIIFEYSSSLANLDFFTWFLIFVFPVTALSYYGVVSPANAKFRLRNIAWIKPFLIGFVCTGAIVVYPTIYYSLQQEKSIHISSPQILYFITNWLFTTAIAIMFDIKDFAADHNYHLKTFVVAKGLRYTIFFILVPLSASSYISFLVFALLKHFSLLQIILNTIPFFLLLYVATSLRRRRGILYYLVFIDGLLFIKAMFGIIAMTLQ